MNLSDGHLLDFGVTEESEAGSIEDPNSSAPALETIRRPRNPMYPGMNDGLYLSTASLDDISSLQVRKDSHRCLGLRVLHGNGRVEILGQWDPCDTALQSTIFRSSEDGSLEGLVFHMTPKPHSNNFRYVHDITPITQSWGGPRWRRDSLVRSFTCRNDGQVSQPPPGHLFSPSIY